MIVVRYQTLSPLAHGGFGGDAGNAVLIRREPVVGASGMPLVPCVSGNSIRGQVRRLVFRDLFARAGLSVGALPGIQWDLLYGALANGGHLTGKEDSPKPERVRELRESLPPLSVLGSALYRWLLPGRVRFGWVWPVCVETVAGGLVHSDSDDLRHSGDLITETGLVRHVDRDVQDPEATGVTPMPVTIEALATGVELQQRIALAGAATEIETGCIAWALDRLTHLGGKSAGGLGAVRVEHDAPHAGAYEEWASAVATSGLRDRLVALAGTLG